MNSGTLRCAIVRGGTSKGLLVRRDELPEDDPDDALLTVFGSPDDRQVDGVGGATTTTSKLMIVGPPERSDVDVSYTFGQVGITTPAIDYDGNCGNMTAAVGPFAIDEGLVDVDADSDGDAVTLRLHNTNTDAIVEQRIPLEGGRTATTGDFRMHGVPGTGPRIDTTFLDPGGSFTGDLFPLGDPIVDLSIEGGTVPVSVVDVTTAVAFVRASALGLAGVELPPDLNDDDRLMGRVERLRGEVCRRLGLVETASEAAIESPNYPKLAFVAPPTTYRTTDEETVESGDIDVLARVTSMPVVHPTYAVTSACCTAAAIRLPGTIPHRVATAHDPDVTIGHPKGTMTVEAEVDTEDRSVRSVTVARTQRRIMDGVAYF